MEPFGAASGVAGLLSLGITVCQGLLDYYSSWKGADDNVARTFASIDMLTKTLVLLRSAVQHRPLNPDILHHIGKCIASTERGIQSLQKKLEKVRLVSSQGDWQDKAKAGLRRALFPFKESTLAKLREVCSDLRDDLALALDALQIDVSASSLEMLNFLGQQLKDLSVDVIALKDRSTSVSRDLENVAGTTKETSRSVDELLLHSNRDHAQRALDWLSPLTVEDERKQQDTFNIHGRQDGIGQWLLETKEFRDWYESNGHILWCPGKQGTGKTVLVSYLVNFLKTKVDGSNRRLAYIYLDYKEAEKQTPTNVLASLICQLAASAPTLPTKIAASYEVHKSRNTRPLFEEYAQLLYAIASECSKVFIVVDAVDECCEEWRGMLPKNLRHLQPHACVLLTSRDLPTIQRQLRDATRLEIQAKSGDIEGYLQDRLAESERIKSFAAKDPDLCSEITKSITNRAEGMFLQARLHLDALTSKPTLRKLKTALNTLPDGLDNIYDEAMDRICAQVADHANMAKKILYCIFYASRPLTMSEIQHAMAVEIGDVDFDEDGIPDEEFILPICTGLVVYEEEYGYLTLVHYTLQQYFEGKAGLHFPKAEVDILREHIFKRRMQQRPLLRYAVPNWGAHARGNAEQLCQNMILSFLSNDAKISSSIQVLYVRNLAGRGHSHRFPKSVTALWIASFYGLTLTVRNLIRNGADMKWKTTIGDTALHRAVGSGHAEVVRLLLSDGADASTTDKSGNAPLHLAASCGPNVVFSTHIEIGHPFAFEVPWHRSEAIMLSLVAAGADVNAVNNHGETALNWAIRYGQRGPTRLLLGHGADVTIKDYTDLAPLSTAAQWGWEEVARILLQYDLEKQAQQGILADACRRAALQGYSSLLGHFLRTPYNHAIVDSEGRTLLHLASVAGNLQCVRILVSHGFDHNALDSQKRSCLHHAAASVKSSEPIHYFLAKRLDAQQQDMSGWTPLLWATKGGLHQNVAILLAAGATSVVDVGRTSDAATKLSSGMNLMVAEALRPVSLPLLSMVGKCTVTMASDHPVSAICDGCEMDLYGPRFGCSSCPDFDYCFKCFLSSEISHPSHEFSFVNGHDPSTRFSSKEPADVATAFEAMRAACRRRSQGFESDFSEEWNKLRTRQGLKTASQPIEGTATAIEDNFDTTMCPSCD